MATARQVKETKRTGTGSTMTGKGAVVAAAKTAKPIPTEIQFRTNYGQGKLQTYTGSLDAFQKLQKGWTAGYVQIEPGTYGSPDYDPYITEKQSPQATKTAETKDPNVKSKLTKKRIGVGRNSTLLTERTRSPLASLLGKTVF